MKTTELKQDDMIALQKQKQNIHKNKKIVFK